MTRSHGTHLHPPDATAKGVHMGIIVVVYFVRVGASGG
jgi:hypothetical protein